MEIIQGKHSIVIKVSDKNGQSDFSCRDEPVPKRNVLVLLDAMPLDHGEMLTDNNGEAHFGNDLELSCGVDSNTGELYIQGGQIFIDGVKIYDGAILPKMHFYI